MRTGRAQFGAVLAGASLAAWAIAVGCSSFTDSAETPADAAAAADGGDAALEATAPDAAEAASPMGFCATSDAGYCTDFDDGLIAGRGWTTMVTDGGSLSLVPSEVSPPNALSALLVPASEDAGTGAYLVANPGAALTTGATLEMDVRIDEEPAGGFNSIAVIAFDFDTEVVTLNVAGGKLLLLIVDPSAGDAGVAAFPVSHPAGWFHLKLDTSFLIGGTHLFVNGALVVDTPVCLTQPLAGYVASAGPSADGPGRLRVTYDNVTLRQRY